MTRKPTNKSRTDRSPGQNARVRQDRPVEGTVTLWNVFYVLVPRTDGPGFWTVRPERLV